MPAVMKTMSAPSSAVRTSAAALFGRLIPDFRIAARAQSAGDARPQLQLVARLGALQGLKVGVGGDELHALKSGLDHAVYRIAAGAADADHPDHRSAGRLAAVGH